MQVMLDCVAGYTVHTHIYCVVLAFLADIML